MVSRFQTTVRVADDTGRDVRRASIRGFDYSFRRLFLDRE
jgi:hypothetical protein